MQLSEAQLDELTGVIEDTIEYACDKWMISGEAAWTAVQCLSEVKLRTLAGYISPEMN